MSTLSAGAGGSAALTIPGWVQREPPTVFAEVVGEAERPLTTGSP